MHLHGDFREARGMVLPTEVTFEPYRAKPDVVLMSARRRAIMTALETTDRFVIYGLSMSPLDAELVQVVTFGIECGRVTEIQIVDPDHRTVARRPDGSRSNKDGATRRTKTARTRPRDLVRMGAPKAA